MRRVRQRFIVRRRTQAVKTTVGLILCSRVKEDVGHVTQVCVLPEHRGRGIGETLIAASAENLPRTGIPLFISYRDRSERTRRGHLPADGI